MSTPPPDSPQKATLDTAPDPGGRAVQIARKDARLKAALKANMARRKMQVRARAADSDGDAGADNNNNDE